MIPGLPIAATPTVPIPWNPFQKATRPADSSVWGLHANSLNDRMGTCPTIRSVASSRAENIHRTTMRFFRLKNLKECTLCLVTLAIVAGAPILVSVLVLLWD